MRNSNLSAACMHACDNKFVGINVRGKQCRYNEKEVVDRTSNLVVATQLYIRSTVRLKVFIVQNAQCGWLII